MDLEYICNLLNKEFSIMFIDSWEFYYRAIDGKFSPSTLLQRHIEKDRFRFLGIEEHSLDLQNLDSNMLNQYLNNYKIYRMLQDLKFGGRV